MKTEVYLLEVVETTAEGETNRNLSLKIVKVCQTRNEANDELKILGAGSYSVLEVVTKIE